MNFHSYTSGAVSGGMFQASELNNQALARSRARDHAGAEVLHKQALEMKINLTGPNSIQAALSYNALGETQLKLQVGRGGREFISRCRDKRERRTRRSLRCCCEQREPRSGLRSKRTVGASEADQE